jgi:hypothetical protein
MVMLHSLNILGALVWPWKAPINFVMYVLTVCLSARIHSAPTGWTSVKFGIGNFYENLSGKSKLGYNRGKLWGTLHEDLSKYYGHRRH